MTFVSRQVELDSFPEGTIRTSDFRITEVDVPDPGPNQVVVKNTWSSIDPALCLRLRESAPKGYFNAFRLHAPLDGIATVGEVVESSASGFRAGDVVSHASGFREYSLVDADVEALGGLGTLRRLDTSLAPARTYLGALGGSGITAYTGLFLAAELREGDIVWVSSAAGAVGSLAVQLAKLRGHFVIGSTGSDSKVAYLLKDLHVDAAFNYHDGPLDELLHEAAPDGIDVYFDNVGGDHLEAALGALRRWGRVALCGAISEYQGSPKGPNNLFLAVSNDLTLRGFRGSSHFDVREQIIREIGPRIADGTLHYRETVFEGLERTPDAIVHMLAGDTIGKTLVHIG